MFHGLKELGSKIQNMIRVIWDIENRVDFLNKLIFMFNDSMRSASIFDHKGNGFIVISLFELVKVSKVCF